MRGTSKGRYKHDHELSETRNKRIQRINSSLVLKTKHLQTEENNDPIVFRTPPMNKISELAEMRKQAPKPMPKTSTPPLLSSPIISTTTQLRTQPTYPLPSTKQIRGDKVKRSRRSGFEPRLSALILRCFWGGVWFLLRVDGFRLGEVVGE